MLTASWRLCGANAHLLGGPSRPVLVDVGPCRAANALRRRVARAGIAPHELGAVLLTHGHADHVGGLRSLELDGVPVVLAAADATLAPGVATELVGKIRHLDDLGLEGEMVVVGGHTPGSSVVVTACTLVVGDLIPSPTRCFDRWRACAREREADRDADRRRGLLAARRLLDEHRPRQVLLGHGASLTGDEADRRVDDALRRAGG